MHFWKSDKTDRPITNLVRQYLDPHAPLPELSSDEKGTIGVMILHRVRESTNGFRAVHHINGDRVLRLIQQIDTDSHTITDILASTDAVPAKALLMAYQQDQGFPITATDVFELALQAAQQEKFDSYTVAAIAKDIIANADLTSLLIPVLQARPGDSIAQTIACDWIFEYPRDAFQEPLTQSLLDPAFEPIQSAFLALKRIAPERAKECTIGLIDTGRIESYMSLIYGDSTTGAANK